MDQRSFGSVGTEWIQMREDSRIGDDVIFGHRAEGIKQGVQEGVKQGVAHSLVEVYEARFGEMPAELRAAVEDTDDEPTLLAWLRLAGTRSAAEVAAAIRSFRAG